MAFTLPPWLQIQPQDFVQAMDRGAQAGLHLANLNQQAMQRAESLAQETNLSQQRMAMQAQRDAEEDALRRWETQQRLEQQAKQQALVKEYQLEQIGLRKAQEEAQKQHWLNMEKAAAVKKPVAIGAGGLIMPDGSIIEPLPRPGTSSDKGFTLAPGSVRYDSEGNVIAKTPKAPTTPMATKVFRDAAGQQLGSMRVPASEFQADLLEREAASMNTPAVVKGGMVENNIVPPELRQKLRQAAALRTQGLPANPEEETPEPQEGTMQLTPALAKAFLEKANGDKDAARKMARDAGYTF